MAGISRKVAASLVTLFALVVVLAMAPKASVEDTVLGARLASTPRLFMPIVTRPGNETCPSSSPSAVADGHSSWGSPIAVSPAGGLVWLVNPDAGSVSVIDPDKKQRIAEIAVGGEPWSLAIAPDGLVVYVIDRAGGDLILLDAAAYAVCDRLRVGPEPGAVALNPNGSEAYVTLTASDLVAIVDTENREIITRVPTAPRPYGIAASDDGDASDADERVVITHLLALPRPGGSATADDGREGRVSVLGTGTHELLAEIPLPPDEHGFPNLLAAIAIHEDRAWLPQVRAAPALPNGLTTTVFAAVSAIDLSREAEATDERLLLNDQDVFGSPVNNPAAAIPSPDGQTLYIVLAGSNLVEVVDVADPAQPLLVKFLPAGRNPRGMALSADGRRGYVMSYLSRSVTILDLANLAWLAEVPATEETLAANVLRGKMLFNDATDPRLSRGSWISCASCHPDGATDGVTWMFPDGPRQSPPLWYAARTRPLHWSAALDELADVEFTIERIQHGIGLAPGDDSIPLAAPISGRSGDLDALAAFMERGIRLPAAPAPAANAEQGRALFESAGCVACHGGPNWTASALPGPAGQLDPDGNGMVDGVLVDVGTLNPADIRGEGGFDPPSLFAVGLTAPYFHDGSIAALEDLLASGHPDPQGDGNGLSQEEQLALAAFLRSIGAGTRHVAGP